MNAQRTLHLVLLAAAMVGATGGAAWYFSGEPASPAPLVKAPPAAEAGAQDCNKYIRCRALQVMRDASAGCKEPIGQLAAFNAQWQEPGADSIFSDYVWLDQNRGTITFSGNKVQFQNASGANMPVAYECDFDPGTGMVLDARARVGAAR
jgi:hypothetical protein